MIEVIVLRVESEDGLLVSSDEEERRHPLAHEV